jgi:hypothetical protein
LDDSGIAGTTKDGLVILEPTTTDPCQVKYRARLNVKTSKMTVFPPAGAFIPLYRARTLACRVGCLPANHFSVASKPKDD